MDTIGWGVSVDSAGTLWPPKANFVLRALRAAQSKTFFFCFFFMYPVYEGCINLNIISFNFVSNLFSFNSCQFFYLFIFYWTVPTCFVFDGTLSHSAC